MSGPGLAGVWREHSAATFEVVRTWGLWVATGLEPETIAQLTSDRYSPTWMARGQASTASMPFATEGAGGIQLVITPYRMKYWEVVDSDERRVVAGSIQVTFWEDEWRRDCPRDEVLTISGERLVGVFDYLDRVLGDLRARPGGGRG